MLGENEALVLTFGSDAKQLESDLNATLTRIAKGMTAVEAKATSLEKKLAAVGKSFNGQKVVNEVNSLEQALGRVGHANAGKALANVFDRSRLAVIEEGSARLPIFGSALEHLGPAGFAAAAGVAAAAVAFEEASKAAEWAEGMQKAAKAVGVTTTRLQEFDFVAEATGTPVDKMRETLKSLTEQVGQLQDNFARTKNGPQVKVWEAVLGTSDPKAAEEQLRQLGDLKSILPQLLDYAAKLSDTQRGGVAKALKIDPEVLNSLIATRGGLSDLIETAHQYGIIVDADVIQQSAAAAEKMHVASAVIEGEMRRAFLDLAPVAADASTALARVANSIAQIIDDVKDSIGPLSRLIDDLKMIPGLREAAQGAGTLAMNPASNPLTNPIGFYAGQAAGIIHRMGDEGRRENPAGLGRAIGAAAGQDGPSAPPAHSLVDDPAKKSHAKKGPKDNTEELSAAVAGNLDEARKRLAAAQAALTDNAEAKAAFEKAEFADEVAKAEDGRKAMLVRINADKGISEATKRSLAATLWLASLADQQAAAAQGAKADRDADYKIEDQQISVHKAQVEAQIAGLGAQAKITNSVSERNKVEARILALRQQLETDLEGTKIDRDVANGAITKDQGDKLKAALSATQGAQTAEQLAGQIGPLGEFARQQTGDLGAQLQTEAVSAMKTLNEGLAEAIANGKSLHDVLRKALKKSEADLISGGLGRLEGGAINAISGLGRPAAPSGAPGAGSFMSTLGSFTSIFKLFGFAGGTSSAPGGLAIVGEHGPEVANIPRGTQISPNSTLRALTGSIPRGGGRTMQVNVAITHDMRGNASDAVLQGMFRQSEQRTKAEVMDAVKRSTPGIQAQYNLESA